MTEELKGEIKKDGGGWESQDRYYYRSTIDATDEMKNTITYINNVSVELQSLKNQLLAQAIAAAALPKNFQIIEALPNGKSQVDIKAEITQGFRREEPLKEPPPKDPLDAYIALRHRSDLTQILNSGVLEKWEKRLVLGLPDSRTVEYTKPIFAKSNLEDFS